MPEVNYDLTYFKFLGGIVIEDVSIQQMKHSESNSSHHTEHSETTHPQQHRASITKRASIKLMGKVSDLRSKFEHTVLGRGGDTNASGDGRSPLHGNDKKHYKPLHVMTLAKGYNSGPQPLHSSKPTREIDY